MKGKTAKELVVDDQNEILELLNNDQLFLHLPLFTFIIFNYFKLFIFR